MTQALNDALAELRQRYLDLDNEVAEHQRRIERARDEGTTVLSAIDVIATLLDTAEPPLPAPLMLVPALPSLPEEVPGPKARRQRKPHNVKTPTAARIHELAVAAIEAGIRPYMALMTEFGIQKAQAYKYIERARNEGFDIPKFAGRMVLAKPTVEPAAAEPVALDATGFDLNQVAAHYLIGVREGRRPIQYVANALGIERDLAQHLVTTARTYALLPPVDQPQLPDAERAEILAGVRYKSTADKRGAI